MINFHVLTLFPDMVLNGLNTSIIGRAVENNIIKIGATDIRDFSTNKHLKVDDYPYGGGAGIYRLGKSDSEGKAYHALFLRVLRIGERHGATTEAEADIAVGVGVS